MSEQKPGRLTVWYCTKWNEFEIVQKYNWNRHIRAVWIDEDWWEPVTWPRVTSRAWPGHKSIFVGYL